MVFNGSTTHCGNGKNCWQDIFKVYRTFAKPVYKKEQNTDDTDDTDNTDYTDKHG